jgi:hypothetical protein
MGAALSAAVAIAGCGGEVKGEKGSDLDTAGEEPGPAGDDRETADLTPPDDPGDTSEPSAVPKTPRAGSTRPLPAIDCLRDDPGTGVADRFDSFEHQFQVCDGPGSDCLEFFSFDRSCTLSFQVNDVPATADASAEDCAALTRFVTSYFLFAGLTNDVSCLPGTGNPREITNVNLTGGDGPRRKTNGCEEEPFVSLHACVDAVTAAYFSGE